MVRSGRATHSALVTPPDGWAYPDSLNRSPDKRRPREFQRKDFPPATEDETAMRMRGGPRRYGACSPTLLAHTRSALTPPEAISFTVNDPTDTTPRLASDTVAPWKRSTVVLPREWKNGLSFQPHVVSWLLRLCVFARWPNFDSAQAGTLDPFSKSN